MKINKWLTKLINLLLVGTLILSVGGCRDEGLEIIDLCDETGCPSDAPPEAQTFCQENAGKNHYAAIAGSGSSWDPYIICFAEQLASISADVHALNKNYRLVQDINLTNYYSPPGGGSNPQFQIGSCGQTNCEQVGPGQNVFIGTFDGAGHTLFGFKYSNMSQSGSAFIGMLGPSGKIINTKFAAVEVMGNRNVGVVVGHNEGEVIDVEVLSGFIDIPVGVIVHNLGGLVGINKGIVRDSQTPSNDFDIPKETFLTPIGGEKVARNMGGLVGYNQGVVRASINTVDVINGANPTGGIAGFNDGGINNCLNTGDITGNTQVGGIAGIVGVEGEISQSTNEGTITKGFEKDGLVLQKFNNVLANTAKVGKGGSGANELFGASDLAFNAGTNELFVLEKNNHRIQVFTDALVSTTTICGTQGAGSDELSYPMGLDVVDAATDYIMIADTGNNEIKKWQLDGTVMETFVTDGDTPAESFVIPHDVAVDGNENIFIADTGNHRVVSLTSTGVLRFIIGGPGSGDGSDKFFLPMGIAVDSLGNIYVADTGNHRIQVFNSSGSLIDTIGEYGKTLGKLNHPTHITIRGSILYVTDSENGRIQIFTTSGLYQAILGSSGSTLNKFNYPAGVAVDGSNNIYVVDHNPTMIGGVAGLVKQARYQGLVFDSNSNSYVLQSIEKEGVIQNSLNTGNIAVVTATPETFSFTSDMGGIAGHSKGIIYNTYSNAVVNGNVNVGGLIGTSHGQLSHSFSVGTVSATTMDYTRVGLLLGHQEYYRFGVLSTNFFTNNWNSGSTCDSGVSSGTECNSALSFSGGLTSALPMGGTLQGTVTDFYDKFQLPYRYTDNNVEVIYWDFSNIWVEGSTFPTLKYTPEIQP